MAVYHDQDLTPLHKHGEGQNLEVHLTLPLLGPSADHTTSTALCNTCDHDDALGKQALYR